MKKFIFILFAFFAILSAMADNVKTIYMDMPAKVRVLEDSIFSYRVRSVDLKDIDMKETKDTIYFRTNKSDLEDAIIFITTPDINKINIVASRSYEIKKND